MIELISPTPKGVDKLSSKGREIVSNKLINKEMTKISSKVRPSKISKFIRMTPIKKQIKKQATIPSSDLFRNIFIFPLIKGEITSPKIAQKRTGIAINFSKKITVRKQPRTK